MAFHLTTGSNDDHRVGAFESLPEAMASGVLRAARSEDSPAFIVESAGLSGGTLVAGYHQEYGWVDVAADDPEPEWWSRLDDRSRSWLLENPRGDLPAWLVESIARAGGTSASVYWPDSQPDGAPFQLPTVEQDWLLRQGVRESF